MNRDEQFFYDNAGFSYDPQTETPEQGRERTARRLAEAERYARAQGWTYAIHDDYDADDSWMSEEDKAENEGPAICIVLKDGRNCRESLGGIFGATMGYVRVVKAELALEHMTPEDFSDYVPAGDVPMGVQV